MSSEPDEEFIRVRLRLRQYADGSYPPATVENMWATPTDEPQMVVLHNCPLYAEGLAAHDVIRVEEREGDLWFVDVVEAQGHSAIRVDLHHMHAAAALCEQLQAVGCGTETFEEDSTIAVDVPPSVDYAVVVEELEEGEFRGEWTFEELAVRAAVGKRDVQAARTRYASAMLGHDVTWLMPESPRLGVFISNKLWHEGEPLLKVEHYDDGDWMFHGSTELSDEPVDDLFLGHLAHVVDRFPEIQDLADLPPGFTATRPATGHPFVITEMPPGEDDQDA